MFTAVPGQDTIRSAPSLAVLPGGRGTPDDLAAKELGSRIVALAGRVASAQCRWLLLVAEFDAIDGASSYGLPSTTRWLSHHCGIAARTARDHVRVARALAAYPPLAASMAAGRISYSHARIIATTVDADQEPELVDDLLALAESGTVQQLQDLALGLRTIDRTMEDPIRPADPVGESLSRSWDRDARRRLTARLDPEHGALLDAALQAVQSVAPDGERLSDVEALVRLAEIALSAMTDSAQPPRALRGHERTALVLHLHAGRDATAPASVETPLVELVEIPPSDNTERATANPQPKVEGGSREPRPLPGPVPLGRLEHGPGIPAHVLERLACSCRIRVVVHDPDSPRNVLDLGRSQRLVSDSQYRALVIRDGGHCAHPGCNSTWNLEAHHVHHWLRGGMTDMDNLILLCGAHHAAHHKGEFTIHRLGHGRFRFYRHGEPLLEHVDPSTLCDTDVPVEKEHEHVDPTAAGSRWDGYRINLSYATGCFAVPRYQARDARRAQQAS